MEKSKFISFGSKDFWRGIILGLMLGSAIVFYIFDNELDRVRASCYNEGYNKAKINLSISHEAESK